MCRTRQWSDDQAIWEAMAPLMFSAKTCAAAQEEVEQAIALFCIEPAATVLDLGCGIGRHALELARGGFKVTGVDAGTPPNRWVYSRA